MRLCFPFVTLFPLFFALAFVLITILTDRCRSHQQLCLSGYRGSLENYCCLSKSSDAAPHYALRALPRYRLLNVVSPANSIFDRVNVNPAPVFSGVIANGVVQDRVITVY